MKALTHVIAFLFGLSVVAAMNAGLDRLPWGKDTDYDYKKNVMVCLTYQGEAAAEVQWAKSLGMRKFPYMSQQSKLVTDALKAAGKWETDQRFYDQFLYDMSEIWDGRVDAVVQDCMTNAGGVQ